MQSQKTDPKDERRKCSAHMTLPPVSVTGELGASAKEKLHARFTLRSTPRLSRAANTTHRPYTIHQNHSLITLDGAQMLGAR